MSYPKTLSAVRAMLLEYEPSGENPAYLEAIEKASPVDRIVGAYKALKDAEGLDDDGRRLLCGAASLIATNKWHGLQSEAIVTFADIYPSLSADPAPEDPV